MSPSNPQQPPRGIVAAIVRTFLTGPLSILVIVLALLAGGMAVWSTPREEEPQIVVPMADIHVRFPGRSALEVEQLVTRRLERLVWKIDGVEHVYSVSRRDQAMVTVRFFVGEDRERSIIKLRDRILANTDKVPPGVTEWRVEPVEIDDVPIVTLSLTSASRGPYSLRRLADELHARLESVPFLSRSVVLGGYSREIEVLGDMEALAARKLTLEDVHKALAGRDAAVTAGDVTTGGHALRVVTGPDLDGAEAVRQTIVVQDADRTVRVGDVAAVRDGPEEPTHYSFLGFGPAASTDLPKTTRLPVVTLAFSKQKGTNAVQVAARVIEAAEALRDEILPDDARMLVTRNYGRTADEKVDDLLSSMAFAILTVVGLITLVMGWREGMVVGFSVPVSFALALFVNHLFGYTINRVTLFALILSLGLVVDDPITNVDNIQRHIRTGLRKPFDATLFAVQEVVPPVIMSTLAIVASFLPMFFITGMMGPYMAPMAVNVPLTVVFSTVCALTFVPWLAFRLIKGRAPSGESPVQDVTPRWVRRMYRAVLSPFLSPAGGVALAFVTIALLAGSGSLVLLRHVPLKMLPFDNKDELQLVVDLPEGSPLEKTDGAVRDLEALLRTVNEVADFQSYVGLHSPIDFNGLVRHYGLRTRPHQADIRVNLAPKAKRSHQSHAIALRLREPVDAIAEKHDAVISIVETPPGPPVLSTITVEVYGGLRATYDDLIQGAKVLQDRMRAEDAKHIRQIDDMAEAPHERFRFDVDPDRARRHGLTVAAIGEALRTAVSGSVPGLVHVPREREPLPARVRLGKADRSRVERLEQLWLRGGSGDWVQLGELGALRREAADQPVYHKNMKRVVFVTAEAVGRPPGEIVFDLWGRLDREPLPPGIEVEWAGEGEWQVTVRVFRDLGIAFGVALVGIYLLMTIQMKSFSMPLLVMMAIPLTAIGIMPGFWLLNVLGGRTAGGFEDATFFTATAMIGMIALGGIVIRNSIVLIEFVQGGLAEGKDLREALLESGAVRFRPIVLTALTTMLGAWPITLDPIFSGLAWALIFGLLASTAFTLLVIPTAYYFFGPSSGFAGGEEEGASSERTLHG